MMFFINHGYRVIAHDRRGHGRSSQPGEGHDMDHYADDLAPLTAHLDLKHAIHVGPFDRRWRSRALPGASRPESSIEGRNHKRGAATDGEDGG
jgi:alpha-beta hydrolase superfamily lysophospholipase